jgi:hypothetical protein
VVFGAYSSGGNADDIATTENGLLIHISDSLQDNGLNIRIPGEDSILNTTISVCPTEGMTPKKLKALLYTLTTYTVDVSRVYLTRNNWYLMTIVYLWEGASEYFRICLIDNTDIFTDITRTTAPEYILEPTQYRIQSTDVTHEDFVYLHDTFKHLTSYVNYSIREHNKHYSSQIDTNLRLNMRFTAKVAANIGLYNEQTDSIDEFVSKYTKFLNRSRLYIAVYGANSEDEDAKIALDIMQHIMERAVSVLN